MSQSNITKRLFTNKQDVLDWLVELNNNGALSEGFSCQEEFDDYFGLYREWDEETGLYLHPLSEYDGEIDCEPEHYPAICVYDFGEDDDWRLGVIVIRTMEYVYLDDFEKGSNE